MQYDQSGENNNVSIDIGVLNAYSGVFLETHKID